MSRAERDAIMERLKAGIASSRRMDEAMEKLIEKLGAPLPVRAADSYGSAAPSGEVSFADRAERIEALRLEQLARRRRADVGLAQRERLFRTLRDRHGPDYASEWLGVG